MNICLISAPIVDPSMPWLAIFQLQSYLKKEFPKYCVDAFDLNTIFFNEIIKNPYCNLTENADVFNSYTEIQKIENNITEAINKWSIKNNISLSRQNLTFNFNQDSSFEVNEFINSDSNFSRQLENLLLTNIDIKKYDLICFSINCYEQLISSLLMSKTIKRKQKNVKIVIGGNIISRIWSNLFKISVLPQFVDYFIM